MDGGDRYFNETDRLLAGAPSSPALLPRRAGGEGSRSSESRASARNVSQFNQMTAIGDSASNDGP